eukprot:TRINITY_DN5682_c0_g1_i1.p1 TRINITY_DN5682_c0_g1~~TRINITY_DN5682_c0_g1_i1.p1  ORF type:complete len:282 (-),score=25.47 TRINITY_DN5682_c0_g1_i1:34-879(-)
MVDQANERKRFKIFYKGHHKSLLLIAIFLPILPWIGTFVRAIIYPGPYYCDPNSCPYHIQTKVPDAAMLPIVLTLFAITAVVAIMILCSSGSWTTSAFRDKVISMISLFFMFWGVIQLIANAANRAYIAPYSSVVQYSMEITPGDASSANFTTTNLYSPYLDSKHMMTLIREAEGFDDTPRSVDPNSNILHEDTWSKTFVSVPNFVRIQQVKHLEDGKYYIWIITPASKGLSDNAYPDHYLYHEKSRIVANVELYNEKTYIDLRAYGVCKWDQNTGGVCSS